MRPIPPIVLLPSEDKTRTMVKLNHEPFHYEKAARIVLRIMQGESLNTICEDADLPSIVVTKLWQKQSPDFVTMLKMAKKARAEKMTEDLVDVIRILKQKILKEDGTVNGTNVEKMFKLIERVTSIQDETQNLKATTNQINIQNNTKGGGGPPQIVIQNPFEGHNKDVNIEKFRIDSRDSEPDEDEDGQ